ncbi:MAG TPA: hypothetical protein VNS32_28245, partial [Flavisolibacter sp.]|nr:hypothetical protein [Flavisolibacter sp.]
LMVYDDEGEIFTEPSGRVEIVDKVYTKAPAEVINEEFKQIAEKVAEQENLLREKRDELSKAQYEVNQLQKMKTDLSKLLINRQELIKAKRLVVWIKGHIAPRIMDVKNNLKLTISYSISQYQAEEKCWAYSCWADSEERWSSYSEYFDPVYRIKADLTDEEILTITHERQKGNEYSSHIFSRTDDKWLTPESLVEKKRLMELDRVRDLERAEVELKKAQATYNRLAGKEVSEAV